jgi:DNA repair protein RadC
MRTDAKSSISSLVSTGAVMPATDGAFNAAKRPLTRVSYGSALHTAALGRRFANLNYCRIEDQKSTWRCLHLDTRHWLIAFEEMFRGTIDGASVHPREVVRQTLARNSAAVIFAHNHPSGVAEPSQADELITQRLRDALALVDVRVLDHLIIGGDRCMSFAERGLI